MPTYQLLRCMVALGGDKDNVVYRHRGNPVAYPELGILQHMHGDDSVYDIAVVGTCEMPSEEMLARVRTIYDGDYVKAVYPAARPKLPTGSPSIPLCTRPVYAPKPVVPANPDPILRPLTALAPPPGTEAIEHVPAAEDEPTDEEIARNAARQEQEDIETGVVAEFEESASDLADPDLLAQALRPAVEGAGPGTSLPRVGDQPQTRTAFRGQARQARNTPSHLPDVSGVRERLPEKPDHDRPRG